MYTSNIKSLPAINCQAVFSTVTKSTADLIIISKISLVFIQNNTNQYQNDPFGNAQGPFSANSNNTTLPNSNSNINSNKKKELNSVQKSQHTFGSAFGPDTKKQDYSEIKGELTELSGGIGAACG